MISGLRNILLAGVLLLSCTASAATHVLTAAEWSRPRSAEMVLGLQPIAAAVREWHALASEDSGAQLVIRHAAGEEPGLWASELRDWLVALGVPLESVRLEMGGVGDNEIELEARSR